MEQRQEADGSTNRMFRVSVPKSAALICTFLFSSLQNFEQIVRKTSQNEQLMVFGGSLSPPGVSQRSGCLSLRELPGMYLKPVL